MDHMKTTNKATDTLDNQILFVIESAGALKGRRNVWVETREIAVLNKLSNWASSSTLRRRIKNLAAKGLITRKRVSGIVGLRTARSIRSERHTIRA